MAHLTQQKLLPLLCQMLLAEIARDLRRSDDPAVGVDDRLYGESNMQEVSVLPLSYRFIVVDPFTAPDARQYGFFFLQTVGGKQHRYRLAHYFFRRISEQAFCTAIPTLDDPVEGFGDDGVVG